MNRPGIVIKRKKIFNEKGFNRYYHMAKIDLNEAPWTTEKHMCKYIYNNFGEGRYMVLAWRKGRKGFWLFWIGEINSEGFMLDKRKISSTDSVQDLKDELENEDNESYRQFLEEAIRTEVDNNKKKTYGFTGYLKPAGRRGDFNYWEDE